MLTMIFRSIFGTKHERDAKRMRPAVEAINALEPAMQALSDVELRGVTDDLRKRLADPELAPQEREFLASLGPAFSGAAQGEQRLYVGGAAGLFEEVRDEEYESYRRLLEILEQRAALLALLRGSLDPRRPFVRVGAELGLPELANVALVGAAYGLAHRALGTVSLLGPVRMDYDKAIRSVHSAAAALSRFVEDVYEEG